MEKVNENISEHSCMHDAWNLSYHKTFGNSVLNTIKTSSWNWNRSLWSTDRLENVWQREIIHWTCGSVMLPQVIQSKGALMGGYRHIYCSLKLDSLLLWFYLSTYVEKKTHTQQQQLAVLSFVLYLSSYRKRTCVHKVFHVSHSELFHKSFLQENDSSKLPHLTSGSSTHPSLPWINF